MKNKVYWFLELRFPKNNLQDWKKTGIDPDEFEWPDRLAFMLSDLQLSTVDDFLGELEELKKSNKIFLMATSSKDGQGIQLKGFMDFDFLSTYFIGFVTCFRKALDFGGEGRAAFISSSLTPDAIMAGFQLVQGEMRSYVCDMPLDPASQEFLRFNEIWDDKIAQEIDEQAGA